jgi:predicted regulator of Ras-like GTPase activity (Roadblock/LC7/MglB family)
MGMQGNLRDMAVADLVQHNCQEQKTAKLTILHRGETAQIFFKDGNVLHAALGDIQGEEVIYDILSWEDGVFELESGIIPPVTSIKRSWAGLLMEGARRLDENQIEPEQSFIEPEVNKMAVLDDVLKQLSGDVNGYLASVVAGMDGLTIAQDARGKMNPETIAAQMTLLIKLVDTSAAKLKVGEVEDDLLTTDNAYVLMRYLPDKHYFLGVAVDRKTSNLGNLRLMARIYSDRIAKAIPR